MTINEKDPNIIQRARLSFLEIYYIMNFLSNRYEEEPTGNKVVHRTVNSDDVIDYSTGARKVDFELSKKEDLEYRGGRLYHSSGITDIKVKGKSKLYKSGGEQKSFSSAFSVHGSYTLDLDHCFTPSPSSRERQRRSLSDTDMAEEGLGASFNKSESRITATN